MSTSGGLSILVAGAAGAVGRGIVTALLDDGATVLAIDADREGLSALEAQVQDRPRGKLHLHSVDVSHPDEVETLAADLLSAGLSPRAVVASLGESWPGRSCLLEGSAEDWEDFIRRRLAGHLHLSRVFLPRLRNIPAARYIFINGSTALDADLGQGPASMAAAAQRMLEKLLRADPASVIPIDSLILGVPVLSHRLREGRPQLPRAEDIGRAVVQLLQEDSIHGRERIITARSDLEASS